MTLRTLTITDLEKQGIERLKSLEPSIDASIYGSHILNVIRSAAYAIWPSTLLAEDVYRDSFPQTASTDALDDYHGVLMALPRKPKTDATGFICVYGDVGLAVDLGQKFSIDGVEITAAAAGVVAPYTITIDNISAVDGIAVVQSVGHGLPVGGTVLISVGAAFADGLRTITGVTVDTFTFDASDGVAGSGTGYAEVVILPVVATDNVIGSVDLGDGAFTNGSLAGALDAETDAAYAARLIKKRALIEGTFTADQIELAVLSVAGNTRAWVVSPVDFVTGGVEGEQGYKPQAGQVCIYYVRDGDTNIYPTDHTATRAALQIPANTADQDVFVFAPIENSVTIGIGGLVPNTQAMRSAIESNLRAYIVDFVGFEQSFTTDQVRAAVALTRDASGARPESFSVTTGDFAGQSGTLITLNTVVFGV